MVAWRDLDDAEAGGSELHAHEILKRWAEAGIDVRLWTSRVDGAAREIGRSGYTVNRRAGRYAVFPRTAVAGLRRKIGTGDALVEIWNGMPFFSPLWSRAPRIVFLHHVHGEMWDMVLSPTLARIGRTIESRSPRPSIDAARSSRSPTRPSWTSSRGSGTQPIGSRSSRPGSTPGSRRPAPSAAFRW